MNAHCEHAILNEKCFSSTTTWLICPGKRSWIEMICLVIFFTPEKYEFCIVARAGYIWIYNSTPWYTAQVW